ncbi:MAG: Xaa-Pro peptidase family protein [Chloroflexota bacterium]|nr:Xaa-Pro peptidase family protein [Chloroflexota bacterium]
MDRDNERIERIRDELRREGLDALICRLPHNVLLLSGYWPVLADSVVVFPREGEPALVVPGGEEPFAQMGWVEDIHTFKPVTLEKLSDSVAETEPHLAAVARRLGLRGARIGYEGSLDSMPVTYAEVIAPLPYVEELYRRAFSRGTLEAALVDATGLLRALRQVKTTQEIARIRLAHEIAAFGIEAAKEHIRAGVRESELAGAMQAAMSARGIGYRGARRVGAFAFVMSGPNGAQAHLQFQQTSDRVIEHGEFVLVHLNAYADGYWADVTRTFIVGTPNERQRDIYMAVLIGLESGLGAIHDGARAADVDAAARAVLRERGYGEAFKHGLGHGVGFKAIYHAEPPILHPKSLDILQAGMAHNVETGIYTDDLGVRIADVVVVRSDGGEVLTTIPRDLEWSTSAA